MYFVCAVAFPFSKGYYISYMVVEYYPARILLAAASTPCLMFLLLLTKEIVLLTHY